MRNRVFRPRCSILLYVPVLKFSLGILVQERQPKWSIGVRWTRLRVYMLLETNVYMRFVHVLVPIVNLTVWRRRKRKKANIFPLFAAYKLVTIYISIAIYYLFFISVFGYRQAAARELITQPVIEPVTAETSRIQSALPGGACFNNSEQNDRCRTASAVDGFQHWSTQGDWLVSKI